MQHDIERPWLISGFFLLFFIAFAINCVSFGESARMMPLVISIPAVLLSIGQFSRDLRTGSRTPDTLKRYDKTALHRMLAWLCLFV